MTKRKKLSDLGVVGTDLTVTVGTDTVDVFLKKMNAFEQEQALRMAGAARARVMAGLRDHTSEEYLAVWSDVDEAFSGPDSFVEYLTQQRLAERRQIVEAEVEGEEDSEWSKDDYLQGLRDLWITELSDRYAVNPDDPEAAKVFGELKRFADVVSQRMEEERADARLEFAGMGEAELRQQVVDGYLDSRATQAWMYEFERAELWLGTRDPSNHRERHFESRAEVDELGGDALHQLLDAFRELQVGVVEGKGSEEAASSSPPSTPPATAEMEPSSGLPVATG